MLGLRFAPRHQAQFQALQLVLSVMGAQPGWLDTRAGCPETTYVLDDLAPHGDRVG